jgi:transposase
MPQNEIILGLPGYEITKIHGHGTIIIEARYTGRVTCPGCDSRRIRTKGRFLRKLRHENHGTRRCFLHLEARKYLCRDCGKYFNQRFPGIGLWRRSTEAFRRQLFQDHHHGISQKTLAERERIGTATVERCYQDFLKLKIAEMKSYECPRVLGIDEHFFTRKKGFATTLCDLQKHRVYDVALGRSEKALAGYLNHLKGREKVRVVCMDLSLSYRSLVRKYFPNARIVADRFHVIRLVNDYFLKQWRLIDPERSKNRGLLSLMRRHHWNLKPEQQVRLEQYFDQVPALRPIYEFKQELCMLLKRKGNQRQCAQWIPQLLHAIEELLNSEFDLLQQLGRTLHTWVDEIACMWRFSRNNGITEGFHNKMEMISRRAFGFRNFENYRTRVRVLCA